MGVSNQLVHYYFRTMDDLFIALMRRGSERNLQLLEQAFAAADPLQEVWAIYGNPKFTRLAIEYMALTNHRKDICAEAARHTKRMRELEAQALSRILDAHGVDQTSFPAAGIAELLSAIPRVMAMEASLGMSDGHEDATAIVNQLLRQLQGSRPRTGKKGRPAAVAPPRRQGAARSRR
jgi:AcrR family transcriptional regulator